MPLSPRKRTSGGARVREVPRNGRGFGNCRLRQFGETVGALCAKRGFPTPLYSVRRAPDVPPEGGRGEGEGDSVSAPVPPPLSHAGNKSVSALSALTSQEPLIVPMTTRVRFIPFPPPRPSSVPLVPSRRTLASARATGRLVATGFGSSVAACPESRTDIRDRDGVIDIDRRAARCGRRKREGGRERENWQEESRTAASLRRGRIWIIVAS